MKNERIARIFTVGTIVTVFAAIGFYWWAGNRGAITVYANSPENGGWQPGGITVPAGEHLRLRVTSNDVVHSFAIGKSEQVAIDIMPGEVSELDLVFDLPGRYVYYCDRWCGVDHWRMRGVITVTGEAEISETTQPLYVSLGIDIDAEHIAENLPNRLPSANRFDPTRADISGYLDQNIYRANSPESLWEILREDSSLSHFSEDELWDAVAAVWAANTTPSALAKGKALYDRNCAACHGITGQGNGLFANLPLETAENQILMEGHGTQTPSDFTNAAHMLSLSPAAAQGKMIRGGMGTGMPMWGDIFADEQVWDLISYIYTFQFKETR